MRFNIEIISDTVCPWCLVGKKRMEKGIATFKAKHTERNDTFSVTWLPFYLNPDAPKSSIDKQDAYFAKFGEERTRAMTERMSGIGRQEGIDFKFGGKTGNTRDSHRLIQLGKSKSPEMQTKIVEQLFRAYFEEEKDITAKDVLLSAATNAGLESKEVEAVLDSDKFGDTVDSEVLEAKQRAVSGVPNFTIQDTFEFSGAQEPNTFVQLFERILQMQSRV